MKKRILSIFLCLCLLAGLIPAFTTTAEAAEDYRYWEQGDPRWGGMRLGSSSTIGAVGCFITSVTKLMIQHGLRSADSFNPGEFVNYYGGKSYNGYDAILPNADLSIDIVCYLTEGMEWLGYEGGGRVGNSELMNRILRHVNQNEGVFLQVPGHYFAVDGYKTRQTGEVYIMDSKRNTTNADIRLVDSMYKDINILQVGRLGFEQGAQGMGYLSKCTFYPSYCEITVPKRVAVKSLPCSSGTNGDSTDICFTSPGQRLTAIGIYKNTAGNYWYQVDGFCDESGAPKKAFIYGGDATFKWKMSDVRVSNPRLPGTLEEGGGFYLGGEITSEYFPVTHLKASITNSSGSHTYYERSTNVYGGDYNLKDSYLDGGMSFSKLAQGHYKFRLYGTASNHHLNGQTLVDDSNSTYLIDHDFQVVQATTPPSPDMPEQVELWYLDPNMDYLAGTEMYFYWDPHANADRFTLEVQKFNDSTYTAMTTKAGVSSGCSLVMQEGQYRARVISSNSAGQAESEWVEFHLIPESEMRVSSVYEFNNHGYQIVYAATNYEKAQQICKELGSYLVSIWTAEENEFVKNLSYNIPSVMIGLSDRTTEGEYMWADGNALMNTRYENWAPGQPDDYLGKQDSVAMNSSNGTWDDTFIPYYFICEHQCLHKNLKHFPYREPTCQVEGRIECWQCENQYCMLIFKDNMAKERVSEQDIYLPVVDHAYDSDGRCIWCGRQDFDYCEHTNMKHFPARASTCQETGLIECWQCQNCNRIFLDSAATRRTTLENVTRPLANHRYENGKCIWCGAEDPQRPTSGACGEHATWSIDRSTGTLTISGTGPTYEYPFFNSRPWAEETIYRVRVEEGITQIGAYAFAYLPELTDVRLAETVTSLGSHAFYGCDSLQSVSLPAAMTDVYEAAFSNCPILGWVDMTSAITYLGPDLFKGSPSAELEYSGTRDQWKQITVDTPNDALLTMPIHYRLHADNAAGSYVSWVVSRSAETLTLYGQGEVYLEDNHVQPWGEFSDVIKEVILQEGISGYDYQCFDDLPHLHTMYWPSTIIYYTPIYSPELRNVIIAAEHPSMTAEDGVVYDGPFLAYCMPGHPGNNGVGVFKTPAGITQIGDHAFDCCRHLTELQLSADVQSVGTELLGMHSSIEAYTVDPANQSFSSLDGVLFNKDRTTLVSYPQRKMGPSYTVPDTVQTIKAHSLMGESDLQELHLPVSVQTIEDYAITGAIADVYYDGTQEQWNSISGIDAAFRPDCVIHYQEPVIPDHAAVFRIGDVRGRAGDTVVVPVTLEENPGIISAALHVSYDPSKLELVKAEDTGLLKEGMFGDNVTKIPFRLTWSDLLAQSDNTAVGEIAKLTFRIKDPCPEGKTAITAVIPEGDVFDHQPTVVASHVTPGSVEVIRYILGDLNGDSKLSLLDAAYLRRALAGWDGYLADGPEADTNGDGKVNLMDAAWLRRYLAGWDGVVLGQSSASAQMFAAVGAGKFVCESVSGEPGETVRVAVSMEQNPGIVSARLSVSYDRTKLELVSAEDAGLLQNPIFGDRYDAMPFTLSWLDELSKTDVTADGTLVWLTFRIKESCQPGETQVTITSDPDSVFDSDLNLKEFSTSAGTVTVAKKAPVTVEASRTGRSLHAEIANRSNKDLQAQAWICVYDKNGKMLGTQTKNVTVRANGTAVLDETIGTAVPAAGYVQLFLLDQDHSPSCPSVKA